MSTNPDPTVDDALAPLLGAANGEVVTAPEPVTASPGGDDEPAVDEGVGLGEPVPASSVDAVADETAAETEPAAATFTTRAELLEVREAVVDRVIARLDEGDPHYNRRILAETYVASLEVRLALIDLDEFVTRLEHGPGRFLGKLPGKGKG